MLRRVIKTFSLPEEIADKLDKEPNASEVVRDLLARHYFSGNKPGTKEPLTAQDFLNELDEVKKEHLSEQDEIDRELALCVQSLKQQGFNNPTEEQVTEEYKSFQRMKAKRAALYKGITLTEEDLRRIENGSA
jgi:hypothetical protein